MCVCVGGGGGGGVYLRPCGLTLELEQFVIWSLIATRRTKSETRPISGLDEIA